MFITDGDLTTALRDVLQLDATATLATFWPTIITGANLQAYHLIVNSLLRRGWLKATIDQWDVGAEYQRDIGLWKCLEQASAMQPQAYSQIALDRLKRIGELGTTRSGDLNFVPLTIAGIWQDPSEIYGQAQTGTGTLNLERIVWQSRHGCGSCEGDPLCSDGTSRDCWGWD